nr:uncharacterized protein LOC113392594 [Vanessa tameamea]
MSAEKKKRKYYSWNETSMKLAIESLRKKTIGLNEASRIYGVPKATLKRRLDGKNQKAVEEVQIVGSEGDLPVALETELRDHIVEMENSLFGITPKDVRELAFQLAEKNKIKNRFNKTKEAAGKKWYYAFMKRHPDISLRQPRATSMSRATGFNKKTVKYFFDKLEDIMDKNDLNDPQRIFNMDETGLSTVQKKPRKILALKGRRQVGSITSGERGVTTTAVCCASAAGFFVPPLIIFKRKRAKDELRDGAPPGTIFEFNPDSGFINKEIFTLWLKHFVETVKPTPEKKVLLVLDGHTSHTKNLEAITYAKAHNVILLSLPAHTTHKLQPLDVSFFKPLSLYYIEETEKWMRQNPGRVVTTFQVSMLFGKAYSRAASVGTAANGFSKTGVFPLDKNVFADYEFIEPHNETNENVPAQNEIDPLSAVSPEILETEPAVTLPELEYRGRNDLPAEVASTNEGVGAEEIDATLVIAEEEAAKVVESDKRTNEDLGLKEKEPTELVNKNVITEVAKTHKGAHEQEENLTEPITEKNAAKTNEDINKYASPAKKRKSTSEYSFHMDQISPGSKLIAKQLRQKCRKAQNSLELTSSPYKATLEQVQAKMKKPKMQKLTAKNKEPKPSTSKKAKTEVDIEKWFCKICLQCEVEDMIKCQICNAWVHVHCACVNKNAKKFICPLCKS